MPCINVYIGYVTETYILNLTNIYLEFSTEVAYAILQYPGKYTHMKTLNQNIRYHLQNETALGFEEATQKMKI